MKKSSNKKPSAKAKTAAKTPQPSAAKAPSVVKFTRERHELAVCELTPAPWNPRGEIPPESVADLVASIASVGVIEPVVVMAGASGKYVIIAGHRRARAAALAKLDKIPADVLVGVDVATAKRMTFIENLQRRDADPLLESNLVAELVADGMTTDEIAAEIGRDRKWVMRRKNLSNLSPSWRKRVAKGEKITTDCLEHIAAYPATMQEALAGISKHHNNALRWWDVENRFASETKDLSKAPFDTKPCMSCANNSGCSPDLFDWDEKPATLGKCLCEKCYKKRLAAYTDDIVKKAESDGTVVIRREPSYDINTSPKRTNSCPVLYVWKNRSGEIVVEWGARPKKKTAATMTPKEREKDLANKRKTREFNKAIRALGAWCATGDDLAKLLADFFRDPTSGEIKPLAPFYIEAAFVNIAPTYNLIGAKSLRRDTGISAVFGNLHVPDGWAKSAANGIAETIDPHRFGGEENSKLILAMFPSVRKAIGEDVANKILPESKVAEFRCRKIEWRSKSTKAD